MIAKEPSVSLESEAYVLHELSTPLKLTPIQYKPLEDFDVLVEIVASSICHTDIACQTGGIPFPVPSVLGHEGSGIVRQIGPGVTTLVPGDKVILAGQSNCKSCQYCLSGHPLHCDRHTEFCFSGKNHRGKNGGMVEVKGGEMVELATSFFGGSSFGRDAVADETACIKVDDDSDLADLTALGCGVMTGVGTVLNIMKPKEGSVMVVFGLGGVGLATIMAGKLCNLSKIIAVDAKPERIAIAKELGATHCVNVLEENALEMIKFLTDGRGADYIIEATGVVKVLEDCFKAAAPLATICTVGAPPPGQKIAIDVFDHLMKGIKYVGSCGGDVVPETFIPQLIKLRKEGKMPIEKFTKLYPFEQINEAMVDMTAGNVVKPVLVW